MHNKTLSTAEVADLAGVHRDTLLRWLREKVIPEPERDHRGWRVFSVEEARAVSQYSKSGILDVSSSSMPFDPSVDKLSKIDWNFSDAKTRYLTHGMHPYPAKFIPQIPNALIQELSSVGETVADIFCGSGTTLLEALQLKRNAVGVDANPIACLISGAKTTPLSADELEEVRTHLSFCQHMLENLNDETGDLFFSGKAFQSDGWRPKIDVMEFWFLPEVVEELAEILASINKMKLPKARNFCRAVFSAIVVSVSKQDSDTRYVRKEKTGTRVGDTFKKYTSQLKSSIGTALELSDLIEDRFRCDVINSNILLAPETRKFDLVVSSPPYPNAYSYHLYHRLRLIWLGFDDQEFKKAEIGSHRKYSSKGKNRATAQTFANEFSQILSWLTTRLTYGRYACFVVGDSTLNGERIDNAQLISDVARPLGYTEVGRIERTIAPTRKAFNPKIGKIKTEKILILKNGTAQ